MADADRIALRIIEEGAFGETPSGSLLAKSTVEVIAADKSYNDSVEDLSVFKPGQTILVSGNSETAANGYKTVVTAPDRPDGFVDADISVEAVADGNIIKDAAAVFEGFVVGQKILVSGFSETANNGIHIIQTVASDGKQITVDTSLTDDPPDTAVTIISYSTITVLEAVADDAAADPVTILTAYQELRHTGESLKQETSIQESAEIRDDRQVADVRRASVQANGDINAELSYEMYDKLLAAGLMSAGWSDKVAVSEADAYAAVATGNKFTHTTFVTDGFLANQWIEVRGFTTTTNNGYFKIVSVSESEMVVEGGTLINEAADAGKTIVITMGRQILNGVASRSFSIEREYTDLSSAFALFNGMMVNQMVLNIAAEQIITAVFSLMGKTEDSATSSTGTGTPEAAPTKDVVSAVDNIIAILENLSDTDASAFTLTINNNLRFRSVIGEVGPEDIGAGKIGVSGTVQMFYETKAIMDKYLDQTPSSLAFIVEDDDGNAYIFDMPLVKYTSGQRVAGGQNADIIADMAFSAYRDPDEDVTIRIVRFDAS